MTTRIQVIEKAREYVGSPYRHQGRVKHKAIDCLGLIACVAEELGIVDPSGQPILRNQHLDYPPTGDSKRLLAEFCEPRLVERKDIQLGSILALKLAKEPIHLAICASLGGSLSMIQVCSALPRLGTRHLPGGGSVAEHVMDHAWKQRICRIFDFAGIR